MNFRLQEGRIRSESIAFRCQRERIPRLGETDLVGRTVWWSLGVDDSEVCRALLLEYLGFQGKYLKRTGRRM